MSSIIISSMPFTPFEDFFNEMKEKCIQSNNVILECVYPGECFTQETINYPDNVMTWEYQRIGQDGSNCFGHSLQKDSYLLEIDGVL